ncbi:MAG TPA: protein kinase, partial [Polyangia bacterium]|nr:protein kinase [Polyangia bacterium]
DVRAVRERTPSEESEKLGGLLRVSRRVELTDVRRTLARAHAVAWLAVDNRRVPLIGDAGAEATATRVSVGSLGAATVTLLVSRPSPLRLWLWVVVAALALVTALALARRRPPPSLATANAPPVVPSPPSLATAPSPPPSLAQDSPSGRVPARSPDVTATDHRVAPDGDLALQPATAIDDAADSEVATVEKISSQRPRARPPSAPSASGSDPGADGDATELAAEPAPNARRIGRYAIVKLLGSGGMADVFLARAQGPAGFEKQIALKVIKESLAQNPTIVDYLVAEARLATQLTHPNVIEIIDLSVGPTFIAMEFVDGADLHRLYEAAAQLGRPMPLPLVLLVLRAVCDGLHAAHQARGSDGAPLGIIHRDVKLANVLVGKNGVVKVSDFGIAYTDAVLRPFTTEVGEVKGTMAYMAPEQRLALPYDRRVDVYGVGVAAYQLLSGARLNLDIMRLRTLGADGWPHLPPLAEFRADLPAGLEAAVLRALSYDPEYRFESCDALEQALGEIAVREGLVATQKQLARWVHEILAAAPADSRSEESAPMLPALRASKP